MSDFIKRSDAVEYVMSILDVNKYYHPHSKSRNVPIDEVVDRINQVPAADLSGQLPKRGEWIHGREIGKEWLYDHWVAFYEDWHCSNCKVVFEQEEKPKYNYCPNCGAKMELQE